MLLKAQPPALMRQTLVPIFLVVIFTALLFVHEIPRRLGTRVKAASPISLMGSNMSYVISLPRRQDRRRDMERLRISLGLEWSYVDALAPESPLVGLVMRWVSRTRDSTAAFTWPDDIDAIAKSGDNINMWIDGASPWDTTSPPPSSNITCATKLYSIPTGVVPEHMILTPARVACWYSHLEVIHKVANDLRQTAFIFEDDIDMERDISHEIQALWPLLPSGWDIVFLGHCWSDETRGALILPDGNPQLYRSRLYRSTSPKCTHAYALSHVGARRLLLHLRQPLFAYSRAIDQALAWLVESGRLQSFSVVPSLVAQRKVSKSDVTPGNGTGSKWKDFLSDSILGSST